MADIVTPRDLPVELLSITNVNTLFEVYNPDTLVNEKVKISTLVTHISTAPVFDILTVKGETILARDGGNVGIGIGLPRKPLHVYAGASLATENPTTDFIIEDDSNAYMSFLTPNNTNAGIFFGDPEDNDAGRIDYLHATDELRLGAKGLTSSIVIDGNNGCTEFVGNVGIGTSNPGSPLQVVQGSLTDAVPVLTLNQADLSEGCIDFIASPRGIITGATSSIQSVRVELSGTIFRLALYVDA